MKKATKKVKAVKKVVQTRAPATKKPAKAAAAKAAPPKKKRAPAAAKAAKPAVRVTPVAPRKKASRPPAAGPKLVREPEVPVPVEPMTPAETEEFRRALLEKRAELVGDVGTLQEEALRGSRREAAGDLSSMPVHMADLGTDNYEMEFSLGLLQGRREMLQEIEDALERIRQGTYGVCLATGKPIGKARLRATPWARFCYEHTLALERGERHGT
ncbi:MAG: TraR/DksA C4-type zinc finger protein [Phycisphaerae bacterium]